MHFCEGNIYITPDTTRMFLKFTRGLSKTAFGVFPFNPFIITNKTRGSVANLAGYTPTQKIDIKYYKTGSDNTRAGENKYFKTTTNLPWGVSFLDQFNYPAKGKVINAAYTNFMQRAQSAGTNNPNWYKDSSAIVVNNIFKRR